MFRVRCVDFEVECIYFFMGGGYGSEGCLASPVEGFNLKQMFYDC